MDIDLVFSLQEVAPIPADHGYALYAAVSRLIPEVHAENGVAIHPIGGRQTGDRRLSLTPSSSLGFRLAAERIATLLPLAGKTLELSGGKVRVGMPQTRPLVPATALRSRLVVIKVAHSSGNALTAEAFAAAARKQMHDLGVASEAVLHVGKRRTLRVKQRDIVGYEVMVDGLTADESITLQEYGIGGKRHMGCGVFVAARKAAPC